ncbi:interleukin-1 receptor-associated kinase 4 [Vigna unguiculata]|uniref:Interleukin-1 receptor-associated kinase 4 n=1 Tax=Vigna unguiculata TaxID=3917 RepID=A0A4D6NG15_VIGUN|nr:interleukin-1 receptor-associated kinase 4 [Vigna unguiculata]
MDTTCTQTALRTILLFFLMCCLSFLSTADDIYHPTDLFSVSCGSSTNFSTLDTRNWTTDIHFLSPTHLSVSAPSLTPSTIQGPYTHARLSHSPFSYSFPVTPGPKFIRLFFSSTSYQDFPRPLASFSVKTGPYTLLQHFNASLNADADDDPSHPDILFREYCINLQADIHFLSPPHLSVSAPSLTPSPIQGPYTHARLSHSPFSYSFPVTPGPKFIRLFFSSTSYQDFPRPLASFSVKTGPYTLLQHFNASLNADADDDPSHPDILFREYCINLQAGENLNITFIPPTTDSYAFINGIEIVSLPPYLYYTDPDPVSYTHLDVYKRQAVAHPPTSPLSTLAIGLQTSTSSLHPTSQFLLLHSHHLPSRVPTPMLVSLTLLSLTHSLSHQAPNIHFLSPTHLSVSAPSLTPSTIQGPYTHARLSHSPFTYSFPVTPGPKFIRLFFYSTSYQDFPRPLASFSVKTGPYTLLQHFNASLNADADDDPSHPDILFREYCINLQDGENLNITFIPTTTDSYAFINGIEIVSMPPYLYYTDPDHSPEQPQYVGTTTPYIIQNKFALETMFRLVASGIEIPSSGDTGMLRTWEPDFKYVTTPHTQSVDYGKTNTLTFITTYNYTAPDQVYRTVRNMGLNGSINMGFNLTWQLPVDSGFTYMLRLHFCQLDPTVNYAGDLIFNIIIADQLASNRADVLVWTDNHKGVPVVKDYVVFIQGNLNKTNLSVKLHPRPTSRIKDAVLNAIEVFKISDPTGSLAGQNPNPPPQKPKVPLNISNNKSSLITKSREAIVGAVAGVLLLSFTVVFFIIKCKKNIAVDSGSSKKGRTSRGGGLSSLPTNLCRYFSIAEIMAATNNFDEQMVVGVGGFGNVYKGYVDEGSVPVAIKRLKPGSQQGMQEFMNEIEMLSQLRHLHLVSLIGYCYENGEMILIYDFMERGTLRDHLYGSDNESLSWKQRVQICVGAARGLHYLHTGGKHVIIHRDVKSTNILLDEKWVAKVSDFGLSRIGPTSSSMTHVSTQVKGSIGYLDPEYYKRQRLSEKSDVYSFGVVLLEVLCGRQPLLRMVEKQQVSLVDWAKHRYEKGCLGEIVDPALKGQITPQCLQKFGEVALTCLLEDGTERPSMNDIVGMLELVLQLQEDSAMMETSGGYEDSEDMFSSSYNSVELTDYSNTTGNTEDSYGSKQSDRLLSDNVFSEIRDPKGR